MRLLMLAAISQMFGRGARQKSSPFLSIQTASTMKAYMGIRLQQKSSSITVSARGTIGFTCLRHEPYYPIVRLISATPKDYVTAEYLYLWVKRAKVIGVGTTQQQLTVPMFKNYAVDVPDPAGMKEFTRVTAPLFKMMDANKAENCKLSELRNALLPKLISGDVDISKVVI